MLCLSTTSNVPLGRVRSPSTFAVSQLTLLHTTPGSCLFLAVRNAPLSSNAWESPAVAATGVTAAAAGAAIEARLGFLHGKVVEARSLSSTNRERTLSATLHVLS